MEEIIAMSVPARTGRRDGPVTDTSSTSSDERRGAGFALAAALLGFFVITLDAVVVNVVLPSVQADLGGGVTGLAWVVDGYTLLFAALLLSAGSLVDRIGARRAFGSGMVLFVVASAACALAPDLSTLVAARVVQGGAAAVLMPSAMALLSGAYPDPARRARALAIWAMGGSVASSSGPVLGGVLDLVDWRLVFLINLPVGAVALVLLARTPGSRRAAQRGRFDRVGQVTAVLAMGGLTFGVIEAGAVGFADPRVGIALAVAGVALVGFVLAQVRGADPMVPAQLVRSRPVVLAVVIGFAFMVGYYGLPFVFSLYLQQARGLTALGTGAVFLPMMLIGLALTPFTARLGERFGRRLLITTGLVAMAAGALALALVPAGAPFWLLAGLLVLVGLGGPLVMPPTMAVLLDHTPARLAGIASGVFNTSRQLGGALAVAVFGALLTDPDTFLSGVRTSVLIAAGVAALATAAGLLLRSGRPVDQQHR
jgi:DHA2 family methylenomycin A resistance protein-like MFS transporter